MPWTGKATYDNFALIGEDVSPLVHNYSPFDTPFLDLLPPALQAGASIDHWWVEEALGPDTLINSTAVNSATAATGIQINGFGNQLQVGMVLEMQSDAAGVDNELLQITSVPGPNSILVSRAFDSTLNNSLAPGGTLTVVSTAELEGSETTGDVNRPRTRRHNFMQIFKKPIKITGTDRAVSYNPGGLGDEFDHQAVLRTRELMRDVEKAVFRGRLSGNSIGSETAYRTMGGLREFITNINSVIVATSFATDPLLYTNNMMQSAWNAGRRNLDIIVAGSTWKRNLSAIATAVRPVQQDQGDTRIVQFKDYIETDFGTCRLVLSPWLNATEMFGVCSEDIRIVPLQGRSFARVDLAKTGDSDKAHVIGEYTMEIHHPDKMFRARS